MIAKIKLIMLTFISIIFLSVFFKDVAVAQTISFKGFRTVRTATFYNTTTDKIVFQITGRCSFTQSWFEYFIVCKEPDGSLIRREIGRTKGLTYYIETVNGVDIGSFKTCSMLSHQEIISGFKGSLKECTDLQIQE